MARPRRSQETFTEVDVSSPLRKPQAPVRPADRADAAHPSPARSLMDDLSERWLEPEEGDGEKKWSPRATIALSLGASAGLWVLIALAIKAII